MIKTTVVHFKRDEYDVYIGRPSKWGNKFVIGKDGSRVTVIEKYKKWILTQPILLASLQELRGMRLGCFCSPAICHGDVLAELANIPTGPVLYKNEIIDITGVKGADENGNIVLRTTYGESVLFSEISLILSN